jgi:outer membrane lipoprotein-sorting protein
MNKHWLMALGLLAVVSLLLVGCQGGPTAEEIVARLKEVEAGTEDAHAVVELSFQGQGEDGAFVVEVWEKQPNKLRAEMLETSDPAYQGAVQVVDGRQAWVYRPEENEVLVGEIGPDEPSSFREIIQSMDEMIQRVLDASDVSLAGEETVADRQTYKLEVTPREGDTTALPAGTTATLWVDQDRWIVLQAHFVGDLVGEGWLHVRSLELNAGLSDDLFTFEVPDGVEVVRMEDRRPTPLTLEEAHARAEFPLLEPGYVPDGATLIEVLAVEDAFIFRYDHSTTSFTIVQGSAGGKRSAPPGTEKKEVTVRGGPATLLSAGGQGVLLTWTENGVDITIAGHISEEESLQVAESLK